MVEVKVASPRRSPPRDGLQPTKLTRDLRAIAELIELCFGERLERSDLAAVREMRAIGSLGPLLWLVGAFDTTGLGLGYVWLVDGRVVGNVSTYRAGRGLRGMGQGWLIANVAVHPDHRRRGVARALMEATLESIVQRGGRWVILQLEHDNRGARALYEGLGFEEVGRLTQWALARPPRVEQAAAMDSPSPRARRADEWQAEMALAARDRETGLAWARPLEKSHFVHRWPDRLQDALNGKRRACWVVDDGLHLLGSLWVETSPLEIPRLTMLLEPSANQAEVGLRLVRHGLQGIRSRRQVKLESSDRDPALAEGLAALGFQARRTLVQMKWSPK